MTPIVPVDGLRIVTLVDNAVDATAPDVGPARRRALGDVLVEARAMRGAQVRDPLVAEHGFSALVEIVTGERAHRLLFDTGVSPTGMVDNARRMGVDLRSIEGIVLSHGHYDHTTGMSGLIDLLGPTDLPVLVHPDAWVPRRVSLPGRDPRELPTPNRAAFESAGFRILESADASMLFGDTTVVTGRIPRATPFETGFPGHEARRDGVWEPDPEIPDDQAVVVHVRGEGLVVLTGCGHSGIVNVVEAARRLTGVNEVLAVVGGYHLHGTAFAPRIPATVEALAAIDPRFLVPAHCTGFPAMRALAGPFGDRMIPNQVGTTLTFAA